MTGRDGETGPVALARVPRRGPTRLERNRPGPAAWVGGPRRPLADDRPVAPRAAREAPAPDTPPRAHADLTPRGAAEAARKDPSLGALARVIKAGAGIAARGQRGQGAVGRDASPVRTRQGWPHHLALALRAVWCLSGATPRGPQWPPAVTLPHGRDGLSWLRREVLYPPGLDAIGRPVPRP